VGRPEISGSFPILLPFTESIIKFEPASESWMDVQFLNLNELEITVGNHDNMVVRGF
jgi:pyruvate formate-lyase activating enzyme-like uncharacterized protein